MAGHPVLDLVGCYAYSLGKVGRDVGELCGIAPLGITATDDVDALLALEPDCVCYMAYRPDFGHLVRILESGANVVTTMYMLSGGGYGEEPTRAIREAALRGGASLYSIASNAGLLAAYHRGAYGAAKSAVMSLTRSAAVENGRYGIRVNAICPGPVDTPALRRFMADDDFYRRQTPMRRLGRPDELAGAVSFLVGPDSSYVSGVSLLVDGALTARLHSPYLTPEHVTA
jgi:NAD(P)-dependent dehydrogenase (short-subunit alcohol dehydrogenase family)